ncbi:serine proteinase stubble-like isoform X2 [Wyeomyia smithii]|uniref:serine proteinase stubble-like isoform X2 n=1 Tax=Wyeomyia smithii TaxID=174621 RepID=UPI002467F8F9|nr:serine proteinase stubble-like isoform X2 [Wyeomyia smithii]
MKLFLAIALLGAAVTNSYQKSSPCPQVFSYDEQEDSTDTWYGTLRLKTAVPLHGIFIDVIFDALVFVFGAYFKDVTTKDNLHFHIEDKTYRLNAGETLILKFYVKHTDYGRVPLLRQVRFNGQNICVDLPTLKPATAPHRSDSFDRPVIYPDDAARRKATSSTDNKHDNTREHSVQPINSVLHHNSEISDTNSYSSTVLTDNSTNSSGSFYSNAGSVVDHPESQKNPVSVVSRFSDKSNASNESNGGNRKRPYPEKHDSYDPIQDPTIWRKPPTNSSYLTSTSRTVRQPVPSYEESNGNVFRSSSSKPLVKNEDSRTTTGSSAFFRGDRTIPTTTTAKSAYFQGDYAFIQNVESSTHYINSYDENICGTVVPKANPLVTHGTPTRSAQFPWHGALYRSSVTELKYLCGATLIATRFALTAAHCVTLEKSRRPVESSSLLLYLGKTNLKRWTGPEQDAKIEQVLVHTDYNYERFFADIALLKLKDDVKFNNFVRPACLWNFDEDYKMLINKVGYVPGWGYNERGLVSEDLSFAQMPVVAHETCIWSNRDFFSKVTSDTSFCAGFRNGTSVCNGDSGGGMVFKQNNRWFLRGIVSVSAALQNKVSCDPSHYAVFTDVAKFQEWIRSYM